jgi:hypothetical protein
MCTRRTSLCRIATLVGAAKRHEASLCFGLRAAGGFDAEADHFDDWSAWLRMANRNATIRRGLEGDQHVRRLRAGHGAGATDVARSQRDENGVKRIVACRH